MKHLRDELDHLTANLVAMAEVVDEAVRRALRAFHEGRTDLARQVMDGDAAIDREEVRIEEECVRLLVLSMPAASDLRRIIAVMRIDNDLERIADLAVDIAEEAGDPIDLHENRPVVAMLRTMADRALQMVDNALNAFVGSDVSLARTVMAMDDEVDRLDRSIRVEATRAIQSDPGRTQEAIRLLAVSRHLERVADHATNIAEDVVYLKQGAIIRHLEDPPSSVPGDHRSPRQVEER